MKPVTKPKRSAAELAEEQAIRRQHAATPIRTPPAAAINQESFAAILRLLAKFKTQREKQGLTVAEVATRIGVEPAVLAHMEAGKMLNPALAMLHKWAEALGQKLDVDVTPNQGPPI